MSRSKSDHEKSCNLTLSGEKFREVLTTTFGLERFCTGPQNFSRRAHQSRIEADKNEIGLNLSTATVVGFKHQLSSPLPASASMHLMPLVEIHNFRGQGCTQMFKKSDNLTEEEEIIMIVETESTC